MKVLLVIFALFVAETYSFGVLSKMWLTTKRNECLAELNITSSSDIEIVDRGQHPFEQDKEKVCTFKFCMQKNTHKIADYNSLTLEKTMEFERLLPVCDQVLREFLRYCDIEEHGICAKTECMMTFVNARMHDMKIGQVYLPFTTTEKAVEPRTTYYRSRGMRF